VVGEVDVNRNLTGSKQYDVYGATRGLTETPTSRQGFVGGLGHETDDETSLIYMRARYYDPLLGRFVSQDSACSGLNWFQYANSNPVSYFDRTGKDATIVECETTMANLGELFASLAEELGVTLDGAAPFRVAAQELRGSAQFVVRGLMQDLGIEGGTDQFEPWDAPAANS